MHFMVKRVDHLVPTRLEVIVLSVEVWFVLAELSSFNVKEPRIISLQSSSKKSLVFE